MTTTTTRCWTRVDPRFDRVLLAAPRLTLGTFRAEARHPCFQDTGPTGGHLLVFPRSSVWIQRPDGRFVADPTVAVFYNRGTDFRRRAIGLGDDHCTWIAVADDAAVESVAAVAPSVEARPERPFVWRRTPAGLDVYRRVLDLARALEGPRPPDAAEVEEVALGLVDRVVSTAAGRGRPGTVSPRHRELAEAARAELTRRLEGSGDLDAIASSLGVTVPHLCRVFRRVTGSTLHGQRTGLRLRRALERLTEPRVDLTDLALELGFSSHSHFTSAFRRRLGVPPSTIRSRPRLEGLRRHLDRRREC